MFAGWAEGRAMAMGFVGKRGCDWSWYSGYSRHSMGWLAPSKEQQWRSMQGYAGICRGCPCRRGRIRERPRDGRDRQSCFVIAAEDKSDSLRERMIHTRQVLRMQPGRRWEPAYRIWECSPMCRESSAQEWYKRRINAEERNWIKS